jgi:hypothetical protein
LQAIRQELAKHGQPNLAITPPLEKTEGTGCATLDWQDKPVAMICFNSGKNGNPKKPDLFLFIADKSSIKNPPESAVIAHSRAVKKLVSRSWSSGDKTYVLAAFGDEEFLKQYF